MTDTETSPDVPADLLAEVGAYPTAAAAHEHGLVILAMRQPCWVLETDGGFGLFAENAALPAVRAEIAAYEADQLQPARPRMPEDEGFRFPAGWAALALWALALVASYGWQIGHPSWVRHGCSSSIGLVERGEWWRPVTAMFLHADVPHLAGNLLGGAFFGALVSRSIGAWRAWPMILACGALGNTATSLLNWPEPAESLGASTAVFGALGILSGLGFSALLRHRTHLTPARVAAPLIGGFIVLGLMGGAAPHENVDVPGHVFGFLAGLAAGWLTDRIVRAKPVPSPARSDAGRLTT